MPSATWPRPAATRPSSSSQAAHAAGRLGTAIDQMTSRSQARSCLELASSPSSTSRGFTRSTPTSSSAKAQLEIAELAEKPAIAGGGRRRARAADSFAAAAAPRPKSSSAPSAGAVGRAGDRASRTRGSPRSRPCWPRRHAVAEQLDALEREYRAPLRELPGLQQSRTGSRRRSQASWSGGSSASSSACSRRPSWRRSRRLAPIAGDHPRDGLILGIAWVGGARRIVLEATDTSFHDARQLQNVAASSRCWRRFPRSGSIRPRARLRRRPDSQRGVTGGGRHLLPRGAGRRLLVGERGPGSSRRSEAVEAGRRRLRASPEPGLGRFRHVPRVLRTRAQPLRDDAGPGVSSTWARPTARASRRWSTGCRRGKGFVLLTGEVGTGKTTLLHALLSQLDRDAASAFIFNPKLEPLDFFRILFDEFGIEESCRTKAEYLLALNHFLIERLERNETALLIIDEAQNLSRPRCSRRSACSRISRRPPRSCSRSCSWGSPS